MNRASPSKQTEASHAQFDQVRAQLQSQLDSGRAREDQLAQMATRFADIAAQAIDAGSGRAATINRRRRPCGRRCAYSAVKNDLEVKLGGALEDPATLRKADEIVTDYPHKVDEAKAANETAAAIESNLETEKARRDIRRRNATRRSPPSTPQVLPLYTQAYNAAIEGRRRWYCLWLCKPKRTISLPPPASLSPAK